MTRWAAALAGLTLLGCAPEKTWHADTRFTESERAAIVAGEQWISEAAGHAPRGVVFDYVPSSSQPLPSTIRRESKGGNAGLCDSGALYLAPDVDLEWLPGLTAHEMAHCRYGFRDGYGEDGVPSSGIMRVLSPMRWTAAEEAQCAERGCRGEEFE